MNYKQQSLVEFSYTNPVTLDVLESSGMIMDFIEKPEGEENKVAIFAKDGMVYAVPESGITKVLE